MAGHSKWKTIKHKKAAADQKRGRLFTKMLKEISVAARAGGGDPSGNPRLRFLLDKAREVNMPLDNAQRAIKRGLGELPEQQYEAYTYEGFGPHGIAVIVDVLTDNKNRAIAEVRHAFSRNGGAVAEGGAVSWMFERLGVIHAEKGNLSEDALLEHLIEYPVQDITAEEDGFEITLDPKALEEVKQKISDIGLKVVEANIEMVGKKESSVALSGEAEEKAVAFLQVLEDLEDVQNVYTNLG